MKALISPEEQFNLSWISSWTKNDQEEWEPIYSEIFDCQRIAEVKPDDQVFEVAAPLYWTDCPEECLADEWYFKDNQCFIKPLDKPEPKDPLPQDVVS